MSAINSRSKLMFFAWALTTSLVCLLVAFTLGATFYRHISVGGNKLPAPVRSLVTTLAEIPSKIKSAYFAIIDNTGNDPLELLVERGAIEKSGFSHHFPEPSDDGYLLLSGVGPEEKKSIVQLIRIADGSILAKWIPDWDYIHANFSPQKWLSEFNPRTYRAVHPLLLSDASIIFNTGSGLVRLNHCETKANWVLNDIYHHSVELSSDGVSVWVPSVTANFNSDNPILRDELRDDSLAEIGLDGHLIRNLSFSKILYDNNLVGHLLGTTSGNYNKDPIHINQITQAVSDSAYWKRGDLLISARHTSTIYLYRPSSNKIIWYKQGPWLNQHSAKFVGNDKISVFGNNIYSANISDPFIYSEKSNQIYIFNFSSNSVEKLYSQKIKELKPQTTSQGRAQLMDDGSLFVEETNNSRLFKINNKGELQWSYINTYNEKYLGNVAWSRYMTKNEINDILPKLIGKCSKS